MSSKKKPHPSHESSSRIGRPGPSQAEKPKLDTSQPSLLSAGGIREVVESIVIAFVLAFLFRTFEAEAFVIPTGSMAPTLMGRHKDVVCDQCGYQFQVSASDEVDQRTNQPNGMEVITGTCPMCRHTMYIGRNNGIGKSYPSYKGDRILVAKFPYQFTEPERWDVVVFKYPLGAQTNFIKRAVGLPGETIRITHGDIFVRQPGEEQSTIARKPPRKILAMLQPVYDTRYTLPQVVEGIWPSRWQPAAGSPAGWTTEDQRSFRTEGAADRDVWLHYQHRVPSYEDWRAYLTEPKTRPNIKPQLISDFAAYNTESTVGGFDRHGFGDAAPPWLNQAFTAETARGLVATGPPLVPERLGQHWVGDLALQATIEVESDGGEVLLELVEGGQHFQARIEVATGKATLSIPGLEKSRPTGTTKLQGPGSYEVMFANVDDQLVLWVNGSVVSFDGPGIVPGGQEGAVAYQLPERNWRPQPADLEPVRIGSRQAKLKVERLQVFRDIYYIAQKHLPGQPVGALVDFDNWTNPYRFHSREEVATVMADPDRWDAFAKTRSVEFTLADDQFFMLGDNSPESKDSRLWEDGEFYVKRELLIGKALLIYWPHSLDQIPGTSIPIRYFPNFWRMGLVR
jgi:signal peptidase I